MPAVEDTAAAAETDVSRARRPQLLALNLFGLTVFDPAADSPPRALATGSVIDLLGCADVSPQAVRSTLARMTDRDIFARVKSGREVYYRLTEHGRAVLAEAHVLAGSSPAVDRQGEWTLVAFTLAEDRRDVRHQLRSRLQWRGFGLLQNGLWIAPGRVDVQELQRDLHVEGSIRAFVAAPLEPTRESELIEDAFDLEAIRGRYEGFLQRWSAVDLPVPSEAAVSLRLWLRSEWAQLARADPRLPLDRLPDDWPAVAAHDRYRAKDAAMAPAFVAAAGPRIRTIDIE